MARLEAERMAINQSSEPVQNSMNNIQNIAETRYEEKFHMPASAGRIITDVRVGDFANHRRYDQQ